MARIQTNKDTSRKDIIVQAAAALFLEKGYKAASMRDLAEKVGVEAASLYNHIRSKTDLLHDICFVVANRYWEEMSRIEAEDSSAIEKTEAMMRFLISQMIYNFDEVHVSDREWRHLTEPYLSNFQTQRRNFRKRFAAIIEKGIAAKEIKPIDASTAVLIILHAISGIESWHRSKRKINDKELEENMITIMLDGLRK